MSTPPIQPETPQSESKPSDPLPDQPPPESPETAAAAEGEEEEEGECGFCLFMKGGGCKDTFIAWEDCVKEAEDKNEDLVEKCAQITAKLKECMDANSDYYEPILRAEKHAEEQVTIELEKEKQDLAASQNQQEAASNQKDCELESKEISTPPTQAKKEQPVPEAPQAVNKEEEGDCGFCLFTKGDGCRDTLVEWENCVKEAKENKEDLAEKCSQVTTRLLQCMDSHSEYYKPIIRTEKHVEEQAPSQSNQIDRELEFNATSTPLKQDENEQSSAKPENISTDQPEDGEEEEGECGFCVFMKGGGCRDTFVDWENCMEEAEKNKEDIVEKCSQVTDLLKQCMDSHSDYYGPILMAEKHIEEQAVIELEKEKLDSVTSNNEQEAPSHSNQK